ncbi:MAG: hypothetical protein Kow0079_18090 [Vicingaceae bacterium]
MHMKLKIFNLIILIFFLLQTLIISCNGQSINLINAQENIKKSEKDFCESELKKISISKLSVSGVYNDFTKNQIKEKIGYPDSVSTYDNEFSNQVHELYYFGKSYFELMDSKVVSFEILDNRLILDGFYLTVGDNINKCSSLFYLFNSKSQLKIRIPIDGEDSAIIFKVDNSGNIKSIYQWVNW